jgi:catechol 2,3-dioxygenase
MDAYLIDEGTRIGGVSLQVADLARAQRFYEASLGFHAEARDDGALALRAGDDMPVLLVIELPDALPRSPRATGLYHFAIRLPSRLELARFLRHAQSVGLRFQGASDHGVSEALYLADTEGNGIEIYADRPRETWRTGDGRLDMGTEPLDVDGLLALLADDAPNWAGLPSGTDIGHVHLQVADLAATERFYC